MKSEVTEPELSEPEVLEATEVYLCEGALELSHSESTGSSRSKETESVLEPIWREKYLGE